MNNFFINEDERVTKYNDIEKKIWRIRVAKKHHRFRKQNYITTYRIKLFISRIDDCCQRGKKCSSQSCPSMNFFFFFCPPLYLKLQRSLRMKSTWRQQNHVTYYNRCWLANRTRIARWNYATIEKSVLCVLLAWHKKGIVRAKYRGTGRR